MSKIRSLLFSVCLFLLITCAIVLTFKWFGVIRPRTYDNSHFGFEDYKSDNDEDGDGTDDQTDILENVIKYIDTKPKYKSKYYATGYPDDGYGVCTDVVAQGLKGAGYDLMELVNKDILQNREKYNIEKVDKNIDFRRVANLRAFFENNATSLTTDIYAADQWQGGDIVVFKKHIGIVSDKRNKKGIALIIHHANPFQVNYEEDILEGREDIVGHYRIS